MNEGFISKGKNSNRIMYTPIKRKDKAIINNKNYLLIIPDSSYFLNSFNINHRKKKKINNKNNNTFSKKKFINIDFISYLNNSKDKSENIQNKIVININKRKALSLNKKRLYNNYFNQSYNKNKLKIKNKSNIFTEMEKYKYNSSLKDKSLFTYNFTKDTQKVHCSTIILNNKTTHLLKKANLDTSNALYLLTETKRSRYLKKNKTNISKINSNNDFMNIINNSKSKDCNITDNQIKRHEKKETKENDNFINKNKEYLKQKLIDSPDSLFYYIYNFIHEKKKNDELEHKIYYSKINMTKKFMHYKKDLEKYYLLTKIKI